MRSGGMGWLFTATLALAGCRGNADEARQENLRPAETLECEALLPPEIREAMMPGSTVSTDRLCERCAPLCVLRPAVASESQVSVTYDCQPRYGTEDVSGLVASSLGPGGFEVSGVGRAAARRTPAPGVQQITAWDLDTPCAVIVTSRGPDPERVVEATRAALVGLTRASVVR